MRRVYVSGNIGAGKSTLSKLLAKHLGGHLIREEVRDNPYLDDFYANQQEYALRSQLAVVMARFELMRQHREHDDEILVFDRSPEEDHVFAKLHHDKGNIDDRDMALYERVLGNMKDLTCGRQPTCIVYIQCKPKVLLERIQRRGRECEQGITIEYLTELNEAYEQWIKKQHKCHDIITVNGFERTPDGLECLAIELAEELLHEDSDDMA